MIPAMSIQISEDARQDMALQHAWYAKEAGADIAERYLTAFRSTVEILAQQPEIGQPRQFRSVRLRNIRSFHVASPFRVHLIFYRQEADGLLVLRVMHGMRDLPRRLIEPPQSE
jgi:toxin ParE1/3/4